MRIAEKPTVLTIGDLTRSWINNSIRPNPEYQRGSTWGQRQQQLLVDSVLRGYPLPRFYFQQKLSTDVLGNAQVSLDVIDGQQRLIALSQFRQDKWPLFKLEDERVPLPPSVRAQTVSWSGKTFSALPEALQEQFLSVELSVVLIDEVTGDEVRDLFIRLQSGTPLTAQQVRDAWPGNIGPYIERLAGKGDRHGQLAELFAAIDRRGRGARTEEEYEDPALEWRQTCAQLLALLLAKERGRSFPSLRSSALNDLYHANTEFDTKGRVAQQFQFLLVGAQVVVLARPDSQGRKAIRKQRLFSLFLFLRLLLFSDVDFMRALSPVAELFWREDWDGAPEPAGRVGSAEALEEHFTWFVYERMASLRLPELDKRRLFSIEQKAVLWQRSGGRCGICGVPVDVGIAEYDHVFPWILGGATEVDNGRVVHPKCHARGLAAIDGKEAPSPTSVLA
jgi:hypothetical protein